MVCDMVDNSHWVESTWPSEIRAIRHAKALCQDGDNGDKGGGSPHSCENVVFWSSKWVLTQRAFQRESTERKQCGGVWCLSMLAFARARTHSHTHAHAYTHMHTCTHALPCSYNPPPLAALDTKAQSSCEAAAPVLLQGKQAVIAAETGSGKTLAYLLPIGTMLLRWGKLSSDTQLLKLCVRQLALYVIASPENFESPTAHTSNLSHQPPDQPLFMSTVRQSAYLHRVTSSKGNQVWDATRFRIKSEFQL
eukprot:scaffold31546_cov20-Tisochrysis_lutea.AAC.2